MIGYGMPKQYPIRESKGGYIGNGSTKHVNQLKKYLKGENKKSQNADVVTYINSYYQYIFT